MGVAFSIETVTFNDGTDVDLREDDILVVVGPNNAGKTSCLREIAARIRGDSGILVTGVKTRKQGTADEFIQWLRAHCRTRDSTAATPMLAGWEGHVAESTARVLWDSSMPRDLLPFLVRLARTDSRLSTADSTENIEVGVQPVMKPMHAVYERKELGDRLSAAFKAAFGETLFLDLFGGSKVRFRVGDPPRSEPRTDAWRDEMERTLHLQEQGDGMRSFVGCLLEVMATFQPIVLIDEPEAFLHSPQALHLGRLLARDKPHNRQLILATHSAELLRGLLNADTGTVQVIRIQRNGNLNSVSKLDNKQVRELWADPLLRTSNLLDGLFHEGVIVCEGDADARFYAAVLDAVFDSPSEDRRPDVMFVHTGGKDRIAMAVRALGQVGVPVRAITDFDVLSKESSVKAIFEALGGQWEDVRGDWRVVQQVMEASAPPMSKDQVVRRIQELVEAQKGSNLTEATAVEIRRTVKTVSAWKNAKLAGRTAIPSGTPTTAYERMNQRFRERGLFIVEAGELERLVPSVGGDGPRWVNNVITRNLAADPELATARSFIMAVVEP